MTATLATGTASLSSTFTDARGVTLSIDPADDGDAYSPAGRENNIVIGIDTEAAGLGVELTGDQARALHQRLGMIIAVSEMRRAAQAL